MAGGMAKVHPRKLELQLMMEEAVGEVVSYAPRTVSDVNLGVLLSELLLTPVKLVLALRAPEYVAAVIQRTAVPLEMVDSAKARATLLHAESAAAPHPVLSVPAAPLT